MGKCSSQLPSKAQSKRQNVRRNQARFSSSGAVRMLHEQNPGSASNEAERGFLAGIYRPHVCIVHTMKCMQLAIQITSTTLTQTHAAQNTNSENVHISLYLRQKDREGDSHASHGSLQPTLQCFYLLHSFCACRPYSATQFS